MGVDTDKLGSETHRGVVLCAPILQHVFLDFCWVCKGSIPDVKLHNHHVIPSAFGGLHGPQVTLCSDHHNNLHDAARKLARVKPVALATLEKQYRGNLSHSEWGRLLYLIQCVARADLSSRSSRNKRMGGYDANTHRLLTQLTSHFGLTQDQIIASAIKLLHSNTFGKDAST